MADRLSWETIPDHGFILLPLFHIKDNVIEVERDKPEDNQATPKRIGVPCTDASISVSSRF